MSHPFQSAIKSQKYETRIKTRENIENDTRRFYATIKIHKEWNFREAY